jgi:hypothetical protein
MSAPAPVSPREAKVAARAARRQAKIGARRTLRQASRGLDVVVPPGVSASNGRSPFATVEEERRGRQELAHGSLETLRRQWPELKERLEKIPDLRHPKKIKHRFDVLMLYGILMFVLQKASRREANREMTGPQLMENLRLYFPEIEDLPHQDTLHRVLANTDPGQLEEALTERIAHLIRNKKFAQYLVEKCYPIALDGTQKLKRNKLVCGEWLTRTVRHGDGSEEQHYVYVVEVNLAFRNGMTVPLLSEFLTYPGPGEETKQDCEQRGFHRAAERLKRAFPKLPILILLDGLYPNGPVMARCRNSGWQFMIVLPDRCLPSVWEEYRGLAKITQGNRWRMTWNGRRQTFTWINDIEYRYGEGEKKRQRVHVVVCEESWEEYDEKAGGVVRKTARHAWLSSEPLSAPNVHERCNLGARHRWGIEEGILVEKRHGYHYEHCFAEDWNAMRCYHYLMRIGHLINVLVWYSTAVSGAVRKLGVRGVLRLVWTTLVGPWLDAQAVRARFRRPWQLRLV